MNDNETNNAPWPPNEDSWPPKSDPEPEAKYITEIIVKGDHSDFLKVMGECQRKEFPDQTWIRTRVHVDSAYFALHDIQDDFREGFAIGMAGLVALGEMTI